MQNMNVIRTFITKMIKKGDDHGFFLHGERLVEFDLVECGFCVL
jgi:hypothetical protein